MELTLGFSPCPNDTFIFDALLHQKIDTEGLIFKSVITDVEELNQKAFAHTLDITKLSFHAYLYLIEKYHLLNSGSALGNNCGPLLIAKNQVENLEIENLKVAIPGKYTTANLLFTIAFPEAKDKEEMIFSEIENAILTSKVDAGVIIHENRFTYGEKGLKKIIDLGEWWEQQTGLPIPLGGIATKKYLGKETIEKIDRVLKRSVEFALNNPESSMSFVKKHAAEMDEKIIKQHIELYVNSYTIDLGEKGKEAIEEMVKRSIGIIQNGTAA